MDGLPFLPGNTFTDPTLSRFHRSQTLGYKNGYALPARPEVGIGGKPINYNQLSEQELDELSKFQPTLTYGQARPAPPEDFVPAHVAWDKKVLRFEGWYKQTVHESPSEHFRIRPVTIYYYLEDDSISVVEPHVENSGMPQGKLIKRQRLPKNDVGDHWHWKDINVGMNIVFYGKVFHIYDLDKWSKEFLESEGIEVNPPGSCPVDPYTTKRTEAAAPRIYNTPTDFDKTRQFLEMDRKVLRFYCVWDDRDNMFGEMRHFILHYYLVDDTLEVREVHKANDGRDPFPILITRHKVPKDRYNVESTFPAVVMELSDQEIKGYFTPRDFAIGKTVPIYNRRFLIYDMDNFSKAFYWKNFNITDFTPVSVTSQGQPIPQMEIAPYNGYGSVEDSLQSCMSLIPQPPKKDFIKMLENDGKVLRFEAKLDSGNAEDRLRRFILFYRLSDDMITIYEPPVRNSGVIGGKFLERTRVCKPGTTPERPEFYGPQDFYIGAVIEIFKHRFLITDADAYVLNYMQDHRDQFPADTIASLEQKLGSMTLGGASTAETKTYGGCDFNELVSTVRAQLKKIAITSSNRKDQMYLSADASRQGFVSKDDIVQLCKRQHLPTHPELIHAIASEMNPQDPEHVSLEQFRQFFEST